MRRDQSDGLPERQTYTVREAVESWLEHGLTERDDHTVTNRPILAKTHSSTWSPIQGSASTVLQRPHHGRLNNDGSG